MFAVMYAIGQAQSIRPSSIEFRNVHFSKFKIIKRISHADRARRPNTHELGSFFNLNDFRNVGLMDRERERERKSFNISDAIESNWWASRPDEQCVQLVEHFSMEHFCVYSRGLLDGQC